MNPSPIGHLFASCDEEGAPQAEFEEVLKFLNVDMEKVNCVPFSLNFIANHEKVSSF